MDAETQEQLKFMPYRSYLGYWDAALGIDMFWYEKIMILIMYLQRLALITMFNVPWPPFFITSARWLFILLLDFSAHHGSVGSLGGGSVIDGCEVGCKVLWAFFVFIPLAVWALGASWDRFSMYYSVNLERILWCFLQIAFLPFVNVLIRYYMLDAGGELERSIATPTWTTPVAETGAVFIVVLVCTVGGVAYSRMSRLVLFNSSLRHETWVRARELEYLLQFTPTYRNERVWMISNYNLFFWWWPLARMLADLLLVIFLAVASPTVGMTLAFVTLCVIFAVEMLAPVHRCWSSNWLEKVSTFALCFYSVLAVLQVFGVRNSLLVDSTLAEVVLGIHVGSICICLVMCVYFFYDGHTFNFRESIADKRAKDKWRRYFSPDAIREQEEQRLLLTLATQVRSTDDNGAAAEEEEDEGKSEGLASSSREDHTSVDEDGKPRVGPRKKAPSDSTNSGSNHHHNNNNNNNNNNNGHGKSVRSDDSSRNKKMHQSSSSNNNNNGGGKKKGGKRAGGMDGGEHSGDGADSEADATLYGTGGELPSSFEEEDFVKEMRRLDAIKLKDQLREREGAIRKRRAEIAIEKELHEQRATAEFGTDQKAEDKQRLSMAMSDSWIGIDSASPHTWPMNMAIVNELMRRNASDHLIDYLRAARKLLDRIALLHGSPMLVPTDEIKQHVSRLEKSLAVCRAERITHHANVIHPLQPVFEELREHLTYELRLFSEKSVTKGHNARKMIEVSRFLRMRMDARENNLALLSPQMRRILLKLFALRIFNQLVFERAEALLPKKYNTAAKAARAKAGRKKKKNGGNDFFEDSDDGDDDVANSDDLDAAAHMQMYEDPFAKDAQAGGGGGFAVVDLMQAAEAGNDDDSLGGLHHAAAADAGDDELRHNMQLAEMLRERKAQTASSAYDPPSSPSRKKND